MVARNKLVISGSLVDEERWSISLNFGVNAVLETQTALQNWVNDVEAGLVAGWSTTFDSIAGLMSEGVTIDTLSAYYYDGPGGAVSQAEASVSPPLAGDVDVRNPTFMAACVSLVTLRNGASGRGRVYLPALGTQLTPTGRLGGTTGPAALAPAFVQLLAMIANASGLGTSFAPAVYSPTLEILTAVSAVRVGNVPDVQRRRKDDLVETYTTQPYDPE